jgi:hypothetical protein
MRVAFLSVLTFAPLRFVQNAALALAVSAPARVSLGTMAVQTVHPSDHAFGHARCNGGELMP